MSARMEGQATRQSTPEELERLTEVLKPYQLAKLRENIHKGHWGHESPFWLLTRLEDEIKELRSALFARHNLMCLEPPSLRHPFTVQDSIRDIRRECADVANFAAMIADVVK